MTTTPLSPAELRTPEEHRASVHRLLLHSLARAEREAAEVREELIADGCTDPAVRADRSKRPASGDPEWAMGIANLLHVNDRRDSILEAFSIIRDEVRELLSAPAAPRERETDDVPFPCDWKEQPAFEAWAKEQRFEMDEHPLHYLFLDPRTNAARKGWNACLSWMRKTMGLPGYPADAEERKAANRALAPSTSGGK